MDFGITWDKKKVGSSLDTNIHQTQVVILIGNLLSQGGRLLFYRKIYLRTTTTTLSIREEWAYATSRPLPPDWHPKKNNKYSFLIS